MIELKSLTKKFGDKVVLDSIDLTLESHKTHILLGSSGCGKSTLLRIIQGLIEPSSGEVFLNGKEVTKETQLDICLSTGYVIQSGGLFPHLTAFENITLMAKIMNWSSAKINNRVTELYELMNFSDGVLEKYPRQLSGGQRQRIGLMRALFLDPDIMFFDEPLGALDPIIRAGLQKDLANIFSKLKKTVVLVTHDVSEAAYFGDTVTLMTEGKIAQHGSMEELVQKPATDFVSEFILAQRPLQTGFDSLKLNATEGATSDA